MLPFELHEEEKRAKHPYEVFGLRAMLARLLILVLGGISGPLSSCRSPQAALKFSLLQR